MLTPHSFQNGYGSLQSIPTRWLLGGLQERREETESKAKKETEKNN